MPTSLLPLRRRASLFALYVLVTLSVVPSGARAGTEAELGSAVRAAITTPALENGITAIVVQSLRDGRTLYATNPAVAVVPASNTKLLTAALALERLGPQYRFRTLLAMRGKVSRGVLEGDLIVKGFGDPTLSTAALNDLVKAVTARGIRRIEGDILVDDTYFAAPRLGRGWAWDYLQEYYAAEVCALSLNSNTIGLVVKPSSEVGRPALLSWMPAIRYMSIRNETVTGEAKSSLTISYERAPGENQVILRGSIPLDAQPTDLGGITVEDAALYCGHVLSELLREAGVATESAVRHGTLPESATTLFQRQSMPLSEILPLFLKPSNNHIGEQLMHTVVAEETALQRKSGKAAPGMPDPIVESVVAAFAKRAGAEPGTVRIVDGSGLSRLNLVTAQTLALVLRYLRKQAYGDALVQALPVAGTDGTLSNRLRGTAAAGNLRAKTGSLDAVSCLSGFVTSASGEPLVFSMLMNNFLGSPLDVRTAQDKVCLLLADLK